MKIDIMNQALSEYEILPRVALLNKEIRYTAKGLGIETKLHKNQEYIIRILPQEEIASARIQEAGDWGGRYPEIHVTTDEKGILNFSYTLEREQLYTFRLIEISGNDLSVLVDFHIFAAEKDLWERIPMRGNTHCHTVYSSDGHEDPAVVASLYRKAGFDYLAITDHHKVDGSVYAINALTDIPNEMSIYYGEEVHVPNPYIHNVNVGVVLEGNIGLDDYYHAHKDEVNAEVAEIANKDASMLPENIEPLDWAWRKWICDTIHKHGGIAILAHPCWFYDAHNTSNAMFEYSAQKGIYDAVEVMMGQEPHSSESNMQIAFWNDLRSKGINITPVGCDDAHRRNYKWNYDSNYNEVCTLVFAKTTGFDGFAEAIRNGYSVAVDNYDGAPNHVVGTYRFTKFSIFLLEQYYPFHDELCFEEGCRMKYAYLGDEESINVLNAIHGRVKRFTDKFFGRDQI